MSIPRTLHQIWLGPRPAPLQWTETWRDFNRDFGYQLWDSEAIEAFGLHNLDLYRRFVSEGIWDGAADVARVEILRRFGGVYADADSVALRPLRGAPFMDAGFFAQLEPSTLQADLITNAFMGAAAGHQVLSRYSEALAGAESLRPMWQVSGPGVLTRVLAERHEDDVLILPAWTFFTASLSGEEQQGGQSYARHFWSTTAERWGHEHATAYPAGDPS